VSNELTLALERDHGEQVVHVTNGTCRHVCPHLSRYCSAADCNHHQNHSSPCQPKLGAGSFLGSSECPSLSGSTKAKRSSGEVFTCASVLFLLKQAHDPLWGQSVAPTQLAWAARPIAVMAAVATWRLRYSLSHNCHIPQVGGRERGHGSVKLRGRYSTLSILDQLTPFVALPLVVTAPHTPHTLPILVPTQDEIAADIGNQASAPAKQPDVQVGKHAERGTDYSRPPVRTRLQAAGGQAGRACYGDGHSDDARYSAAAINATHRQRQHSTEHWPVRVDNGVRLPYSVCHPTPRTQIRLGTPNQPSTDPEPCLNQPQTNPKPTPTTN
jgi:hypothetical protein